MAIVCYLVALVFVVALIVLPFQMVYAVGCFLGFLAAYVWYPSRSQYRIKRDVAEGIAEEVAGELVLQLIIELPIRILLWLLKLPFRALQHADLNL
ncbi:MAG: hypothetical protein VXW65_12860 [Pseudomonadota bacterium]|nr:hypothetical protein [Pseudomonadota bacterium]